MNAEFQRITQRDKKAFLSDQYKEIEENNRMGKIRELFKKTEISSRKLEIPREHHAKMGTIKDRNGMDLKEEDIKKRWPLYTENYTKKIFMIQITTMV